MSSAQGADYMVYWQVLYRYLAISGISIGEGTDWVPASWWTAPERGGWPEPAPPRRPCWASCQSERGVMYPNVTV